MLWLAGLLGVMAVGAVGVFDMDGDSDETQDDELDGELDADEDTAADTDTPDDADADSGDTIYASGLDDTINGSNSDDSLHGQNGDDSIDGGDGNDTLFGNEGDDTLSGGAGNDALQGSNGNDVAQGGAGDDAIQGGLGDDTLSGGAGNDSLFGGWGNDIINGVQDDSATQGITDIDDSDFLNGGDGDDVIIAGNDDIVTPGDGADTIIGGSWIADGQAMQIIDFNAEDDNILLVYEDDADVPDITLQPDPDDATITQVLMDGVAVAAQPCADGRNSPNLGRKAARVRGCAIRLCHPNESFLYAPIRCMPGIMAPYWTTSRAAASYTRTSKGDPDVDHDRRKSTRHERIRNQRRRHRVARSTGCHPQLAHRHADRALQNAQKRQPWPPWSAENGGPAPQASGLHQSQRRSALPRPDQASGPAPLKPLTRNNRKSRAVQARLFCVLAVRFRPLMTDAATCQFWWKGWREGEGRCGGEHISAKHAERPSTQPSSGLPRHPSQHS
jgi:hypothetical protein